MNTNSNEYRQSCRVRQTLERQQIRLDFLINATPTGYDRERLTEANMHLLLSIATLHDLKPAIPTKETK